MANCYCKYCGNRNTSVSGLLSSGTCGKNPEGKNHALYEGAEKPRYTCKYCGSSNTSISGLTSSGSCLKNPSSKKNHVPAL